MKSYNIQALRAVAAVCVVYLHSGFRLFGLAPFGGFGVDVFFVISGFIMAMIVSNGGDRFFARRLIRILPLYWTATLAVFIIAGLAPNLLKSTRPDVMELMKSLLFVPFRKESGLIQPMLFLGWTLNFEMFFYAVIAVSLVINRRRALLIAAFAIVAVVAACTPYRQQSTAAEFYSNPVALEFILGIVAYFLSGKIPGAAVKRYSAILWITACSGILAQIWMEEIGLISLRTLRTATFGGASFAVVLSVAVLSRHGLDVRWKWVVAIGDASYALYIIHPYVEYVQEFLARNVYWIGPRHLPGSILAIIGTTLSAIHLHRRFELPVVSFLSKRLLLPKQFIPSPAMRPASGPVQHPVAS